MSTQTSANTGTHPRIDNINTILIPTDFSEAAHNAFLYGLGLADALGAEVHLLHVYTLGHIPVKWVPEAFVESLKQEKVDKAMTYVYEYAAEAQATYGTNVKLSYELVQGQAKDIILKKGDSGKYDVLLMGTQGATSEYGKVFGSLSLQVLQDANCPVLVVPEEARFTSPKRLLFAMNIEAQDTEVIDELFSFCCRFDAHLTCCHISSDPEHLAESKNDRLMRLRELEKTELVDFILIEDGDILRGLQNYLSSHAIDLLVMLTHKRLFANPRFADSLTQEMALRTEMPLLVLHEKV
jgi:nucleotide-binding universal stress UspA family protein